MNAKLMFKSVFLVVIALLLVLMGMNNLGDAALAMPPLMPKVLHQPAAIMYVGFFGLGFVSGAILLAGGKRGGKSKSG